MLNQVVTEIIHSNIKCQVFFYEDLPYAADATEKEWKTTNSFIKKNNLLPITVPIDLNLKLRLLDFYKSQTDKSYYDWVAKRANELKIKNMPGERVYFLGKL